MGLDFFTFNEISSEDFGAYVSGYNTFGFPERDETKVEVAGRNGDLTFDNGRWKNKNISYKCLIYKDFEKNYEALSNKLMSMHGYQRLEDTIQPDVFRVARLVDETNLNMHGDYEAAGFEVVFDAKPQKFLKSGEKSIEFTSAGSIMNPTEFIALPLIRVYSVGTLQINNASLVISSVSGYVDIDCDLQNAYKGSTNCNANISGTFPTLRAGINNIVLNTISKIEIIPRWWRL